MKNKLIKRLISVVCASTMSICSIPAESIAESKVFAPSVKAAIPKVNENGMISRQQNFTEKKAAGDVLTGDVNSDGTVDLADAEKLLSILDSVKLADYPQADVNGDGVIETEDADMIQSFADKGISYFPIGNIYDSSAKYVTRGEWIHNLVEGFDMSVEDESSIVNFYTDLNDYAYGKDIELAANFGLFDVLDEKFNPNEYVTRDFAAHTLNYCLGYPNDVECYFTDIDDVYYSGDAQIALSLGWFKTINDEFRPSMFVTVEESEKAFAEMRSAVEEVVIDENAESEIVLNDDVIVIDDTEDINISNDTVTITGSSKTIKDGQDFSFTVNGFTLVAKAVSVKTDGNVMTIETDTPEDDAVESANDEGFADIDYDNIEVLDENFTFEVDDDAENPTPVSDLNLIKGYRFGSFSSNKNASGTIEFNKKLKFGGKLAVAGSSVEVNGTVENMRVPYQFDGSIFKVNRFYIDFMADASVDATLKTSMSNSESCKLDILKVPAKKGIISVNVIVSLSISLDGQITVTYSCEAGAGVHYDKGDGWRFVKNFKEKSFIIEGKLKEKIEVKIKIEATVLKKKIGEIYGAVGEVGEIHSVRRNASLTCDDFKAYIYAEAGASLNIFNIIKFNKTWTIFDENNSPLRCSIHWENEKKVSKCTYNQESSTIAAGIKNAAKGGGSISGAKSAGYKKAPASTGSSTVAKSGYSSGYVKTTHSVSTVPVYYTASKNFKEIEPPTYITSDTTLTADMNVYTDLYIDNRATLDLNGHNLKVDGDLYILGSTLVINKGFAKITGSVYDNDKAFNSLRCGAEITMTNKEDKILVEGSYYANQYGVSKMTAGTLEIQGDIIGDYINSTDMHTVVLSGTKDQTIDLSKDNISFNMLEIKNSDKKKLIVDKYFLAGNTMSVDGDSLTFVCNDSGNEKTDIRLGKISCDKLNFNGKLTLRSLDFTGSEINFSDDLNARSSAEINFNGAVVNVKGNLHDNNSKITLGGSTLNIDGNFDNSANSSFGFVMNNKKDRLNIKGDLKIDAYSSSAVFSEGIITIGGDIKLKSAHGGGIEFTGYNKVILNGEDDVTVYFGNYSSSFNDLEILNLDKRKVYVDGYFNVSGTTECGENPLNIISREGKLSFGELNCSELNVSGDVQLYGSTKLNCPKATFDKNVTLDNPNSSSAVFSLNGAEMNVKGDFFHKSRKLDLKKGTLNVKNYTIDGTYDKVLSVNGGKFNVDEDFTTNGTLEMTSPSDSIVIGGDFTINSNASFTLKDGTIECAGTITGVDNGPKSTDNFKMILTGEEDQIININSYPSNGNEYHFANLEVKNADTRNIILKDLLDVGTLTSDGEAVNITSKNGRLANAKLLCDVNVSGNLIGYAKSGYSADNHVINLNGHSMNVDGNFYQNGGTLLPNAGKFITNDYLIVNDEDSAVFTASDGILKMVNDRDYVLVNGNFKTYTKNSHKDMLTAGTLEIKGDFYQYGAGTKYAFPASGKHLTILSGEEKQNVTFESYPDSHFNIIKMTQNEEMYEFSENPCWNELAGEIDPPENPERPGDRLPGDANGDGSVDLKDVTVMRRELAGGWDQTIILENADVNGDESFDLKDVTILRQYLAGWDVVLK